ncbi:hypothetical protein [Brevibacillus laterosporus]|uniref:Uncharacterized protein n=1 Tax=Brevibacillus laterosporus TaxID=1465 RepID=A0AAP3DJG0_BRELA|nr:hypothetical protein [Brevibacillus laterosporus]MCR8982448.1 hypothetical protein [Brevibacillus laterosporus]MCZ0809604.1 hypothetical protein [Brevibacillus laterosporus]MCZ0828137.1 hypothetical protein [Brevibacillus laterosporus]MCZ0852159.1 hypothetical protein [Brevibacillus laterosporus]
MQMTTEKTVGEKIIQQVADETELDRDKAKTCIRSFVGAVIKQTEKHGNIDLSYILGAGAEAKQQMKPI